MHLDLEGCCLGVRTHGQEQHYCPGGKAPHLRNLFSVFSRLREIRLVYLWSIARWRGGWSMAWEGVNMRRKTGVSGCKLIRIGVEIGFSSSVVMMPCWHERHAPGCSARASSLQPSGQSTGSTAAREAMSASTNAA